MDIGKSVLVLVRRTTRSSPRLEACLPTTGSQAAALVRSGSQRRRFALVGDPGTALETVFALMRCGGFLAVGGAGRPVPELVQSDVMLTNRTGVFSASLPAKICACRVLYFAKDFRRMIRNQSRQKGGSRFDVQVVASKDCGIVGYGDIGRAVATRYVERARGCWLRSDMLPRGMTAPDRTLLFAGAAEDDGALDYGVVAARLSQGNAAYDR